MARMHAAETGQGASKAAKAGPIDMDHLDSQTMGDPGLREEVLRLYASMSGVYLSRIQSSVDADELLSHLHTLRSAAAGIGAVEVRDRAREAEEAIRAGAPADPARLLAIATAVAQCQEFIHDMVGPE